MGCVNDKSNHKSSNHSFPLDSKPYIEQCTQLINEYSRIEKELSKQRAHLNNLIQSQKKQELTLSNLCFSKSSLIIDNKNDWINQNYYTEMQLLSELEKKVLAEPSHYSILIEKTNRISSNFTRLVKQLNSTKAAHKKLVSMGLKYGVQNHQDFEISYIELKKHEDKFFSYFERSQTRNKISLSQATQSTNSTF